MHTECIVIAKHSVLEQVINIMFHPHCSVQFNAVVMVYGRGSVGVQVSLGLAALCVAAASQWCVNVCVCGWMTGLAQHFEHCYGVEKHNVSVVYLFTS